MVASFFPSKNPRKSKMNNRDYVEYCGVKQLLEKVKVGAIVTVPDHTEAIIQFLETREKELANQQD